MVGENPTPYGILALWAVNGLSIVYWALHLTLHVSIQKPGWGTLVITPKWTYSTILTKIKSHLAHFDHARYPYISLIQSDLKLICYILIWMSPKQEML